MCQCNIVKESLSDPHVNVAFAAVISLNATKETVSEGNSLHTVLTDEGKRNASVRASKERRASGEPKGPGDGTGGAAVHRGGPG